MRASDAPHPGVPRRDDDVRVGPTAAEYRAHMQGITDRQEREETCDRLQRGLQRAILRFDEGIVKAQESMAEHRRLLRLEKRLSEYLITCCARHKPDEAELIVESRGDVRGRLPSAFLCAQNDCYASRLQYNVVRGEASRYQGALCVDALSGLWRNRDQLRGTAGTEATWSRGEDERCLDALTTLQWRWRRHGAAMVWYNATRARERAQRDAKERRRIAKAQRAAEINPPTPPTPTLSPAQSPTP